MGLSLPYFNMCKYGKAFNFSVPMYGIKADPYSDIFLPAGTALWINARKGPRYKYYVFHTLYISRLTCRALWQIYLIMTSND